MDALKDESYAAKTRKSGFPSRGSLHVAFIRRVVFWYKLISTCRGLDGNSILNLFSSALVDSLNLFVRKTITNPTFRRSGMYRIEPFGFTVFARGGTEDLYYASPKRERIVTEFIRKTLRKGDVFVDIGANIGYFTMIASPIVGDKGKVIAVEPIPETAKVLKLNLTLNKLQNVKVIQKAAWFKRTKLHMEIPQGFYGLASGVVDYRESKSVHQVDAIPLDPLLESYSELRLIKIDVEGAELQVLHGLKHALLKTFYIVLEASTHKDRIVDSLISSNFACRSVGATDYLVCFNKSLRQTDSIYSSRSF